MLTESFVTSIRAQQKIANTAISKDVGIYLHTLNPSHTVKSSFKKSSTAPNGLAATSTHVFAAQVDKAVVHVYSKEKSNQEALISFPERIHSLTTVGESVVVVGTAEGRIILWETFTGRQVSTPTAHLQPITCIVSTPIHLITGSADSNIHVWSLPKLLSTTTTEAHEPILSLSNHRAAITSLAVGHGANNTNIVVSASKDNTCIVWNYHTGDLLRTFLLPSTPLCLALDPCDRAFYVGFEDGSIQLVDFFQPNSTLNPLYDTSLQSTPVQISATSWSAPNNVGEVHCMAVSYDGTSLITGHATGKVIRWDTGRRDFSAELVDLSAPVTNILMVSPFPEKQLTRAVNIVKPRLSETNYTFTAQFTGDLAISSFAQSLRQPGLPVNLLEAAILDFSKPAQST